MPAEKIVSQFNKTDLFAVLPPGLLIFLFTYVAYATHPMPAPGASYTLWTLLQRLADQLQQKPALLIYIVFAAYLLGSLVRTLPVIFVERLLLPGRLFYGWARGWLAATFPKLKWHLAKSHPNEAFPYSSVLHTVAKALQENTGATGINASWLPVLGNEIPMYVYNYWKDALCLSTPTGFEYYQTFETRVRFFTGMIWAGLVGIFAALAILVRCQMLFQPVGILLLELSLILFITFSANFRRVRRQEVRALFLIFGAHLQNKTSQMASHGDSVRVSEGD